jgi:hypothetical protein
LRAAKAARVFAASLRTEHRSGPARFAPARNPGVFLFAYFLLDKQKKVSRTTVRNPKPIKPLPLIQGLVVSGFQRLARITTSDCSTKKREDAIHHRAFPSASVSLVQAPGRGDKRRRARL